MAEDARLVQRVLAAVPARSYAMNAILSLLRVEASRAVPTARISCERRPVLSVNPDFVARYCATDERLFMLVMHELHHVLLGHTRLFPRVTLAHNLAFDAVINALLARRFPALAYTSFFSDLYGSERTAARLLAPPGPIKMESEPLNALHELLYGSRDVTAEEIFHATVRELAGAGNLVIVPVLLGNHGAEGVDDWGTAGPLDRDLVEEIRNIVERWPRPERPTRGRSLAMSSIASGSPASRPGGGSSRRRAAR